MITLNYPYGATKLDPDEIEGLIPQHISTHAQLNEWEQENILSAENWYSQRKFSYAKILEIPFINGVHRRMFNQTWIWAGKYRNSEKSIGINPFYIPMRLGELLEDVIYHIKHESYFIDEIVVRFHHRLVSIHPYPNGNGRHARFVADLLLISKQKIRFSWGSQLNDVMTVKEIRKKYIDALRAADKQNYQPLLEFVR